MLRVSLQGEILIILIGGERGFSVPFGLGNMFCKKVFYETFCSNETKLFERREYDVRAFLIKFQYWPSERKSLATRTNLSSLDWQESPKRRTNEKWFNPNCTA